MKSTLKSKNIARMVSTRGVKFKFTEGEKVLCYEPDPTKARVLYDSKVLEVKANKDQRGRRAVEYLIHFQGWNSSWDRCVCEDYVLKDTEENRQLQKDLAKRAQLQIGSYLYRRERKKRDRKTVEVTESVEGKKSRESDHVDGDTCESSGDDSSCSRSQHDGDENHEDEDEDTMALNYRDYDDGQEMDDDDDDDDDDEEEDDDKVPLQLSDTLKRLLEQDHDLINKKNKVVKLPAEPNVVTILEGYLKHCAVNQLCGCNTDKPQCRMRSQQTVKARDVEKIRRSLIVCMEVLHGVRMFFDETLGTLLLYNNERQQFDMVQNDPVIKQEQDTGTSGHIASCRDYADVNVHVPEVKQEMEDEVVQGEADSESHFTNNYETLNGAADSGRKRLRSYRSSNAENFSHHTTNGFSKDPVSRDEDSEDNFPLSHIKQELPCNSIASVSSRCSSPNATSATNQLGKCNKLLNCILAWHMVPDSLYSEKPVYASLVYGAIHLARLFESHLRCEDKYKNGNIVDKCLQRSGQRDNCMKLPDLLSACNMSEKRLKVVLHYLDDFLSYLEEHSEWFGESFYKDNLLT